MCRRVIFKNFKTVDEYLESLYQNWRTNPTGLFGNILIDQLAQTGYSTLCPPIPWMGNIEDASCALVSFEPRLDNNTFFQQARASFTYSHWRSFYFEHYFDGFEAVVEQPLSNYWAFLGHLSRGLTPHIDFNWQAALSNNLVEFPFCQYHSCTHPKQPVTNQLRDDFIRRLIFYSHNRTCPKVLALGRPISDFIRNEFGGQVVNQNILGEGFNLPIEARTVIINGIRFLFFLRNGPFSMGHGENFESCFNIGHVIANYQCP